MNVVTVEINGTEYSLRGEESEEYLYMVANYVDKKMKETIENKQGLSVSSAAVLTAVNAADEMYKVQKINQELKEQLKHMQKYNDELQIKIKDGDTGKQQEKISKLKEELDDSKENINILSEKNKELEIEIQTYKNKIIDMQNKLIENQINLVKAKKLNSLKNPPLRKKL